METVVSPPVEGAKKRIAMSSVTRSMFYLLLTYVVMCVYLSLAAPNFLTERNLVNILRQMSMIAIIGVGYVNCCHTIPIRSSCSTSRRIAGHLISVSPPIDA